MRRNRFVEGLCAVLWWAPVSMAVAGTVEIGKPAPDFELTSCDGKAYKLSNYKGKVVVLEWWNQDCPVTRHYMPTMKKLATEHADKGVVWLAIDSTRYQTAAKDAECVRENGIPYPLLMDTAGKIGRTYGAKTTPHMFVINRGTIAYMGAIGDRDGRNYVAEALGAILAGKEVSLTRTQPFGCSVKYAKSGATEKGADAPKIAELGKPAPDFALTGIDGKPYRLSDYRDEIVVLEWWNQDCPVTRRYMPTMKKLATEHADKGVVWLAIDSTHYQTAAKDAECVRRNSIPYPLLMDSDGKVGRAYGAKTTPHMFVINKGTVVYAGAIDNKGSRNYVAEALGAVLSGKEVPLAKTQPFGCSVKYKK